MVKIAELLTVFRLLPPLSPDCAAGLHLLFYRQPLCLSRPRHATRRGIEGSTGLSSSFHGSLLFHRLYNPKEQGPHRQDSWTEKGFERKIDQLYDE